MPNTKDIDLWKAFKILLISPNGVGKSVAAASFYEAGPIHFDDFDGRMAPIKLVYPNADIEYTSYGIDDFKNYLNWLEMIQKTPPKFKTWVTDSLTSLSTSCVMYQLTVKGKVKTGAAGLPATSWDEINGETVIISKVLEIMKVMNENYGINIIMTAHPISKTVINPAEGEAAKFETLVTYGNKIGQMVPGYFNEIYRLTTKKLSMNGIPRRVALTSLLNDNTVLAKSALPIPAEIDISDGLYQKLLSFRK